MHIIKYVIREIRITKYESGSADHGIDPKRHPEPTSGAPSAIYLWTREGESASARDEKDPVTAER